MSTKGTFFVKNTGSGNISGYVRYKNEKKYGVNFNDLAPNASTDTVKFESGAGTHDSWYYHITVNGEGYHDDKSCAYYAKDEGHGPVEITISNDRFKVSPPVSGSCEQKL